jgi:hypothetical protein
MDALLAQRDVCEIIGISPVTLFQRRKRGTAPPFLLVGARFAAIRFEDFVDWLVGELTSRRSRWLKALAGGAA